jgi:hypothetical protein
VVRKGKQLELKRYKQLDWATIYNETNEKMNTKTLKWRQKNGLYNAFQDVFFQLKNSQTFILNVNEQNIFF